MQKICIHLQRPYWAPKIAFLFSEIITRYATYLNNHPWKCQIASICNTLKAVLCTHWFSKNFQTRSSLAIARFWNLPNFSYIFWHKVYVELKVKKFQNKFFSTKLNILIISHRKKSQISSGPNFKHFRIILAKSDVWQKKEKHLSVYCW